MRIKYFPLIVSVFIFWTTSYAYDDRHLEIDQLTPRNIKNLRGIYGNDLSSAADRWEDLYWCQRDRREHKKQRATEIPREQRRFLNEIQEKPITPQITECSLQPLRPPFTASTQNLDALASLFAVSEEAYSTDPDDEKSNSETGALSCEKQDISSENKTLSTCASGTRRFTVLPIEFSEGVKIPKITTTRKKGKRLELMDFVLILRNGERYKFGIKGGQFTHLDPFEPKGNSRPNHFNLFLKDNTQSFGSNIPSILHKRGGNQVLRNVKLDVSNDVSELTIRIYYDQIRRSFFADGKVLRDWAN